MPDLIGHLSFQQGQIAPSLPLAAGFLNAGRKEWGGAPGREQETGELYGEYISLNFCELPRLRVDSFEELSPKEEWFQLLKNMRTFALNPKGVPERMRKVLEASRISGLPDKELQQYFRAMVTDNEREDIAIANYRDGRMEGKMEAEEQVRALPCS